MPQRTWSARRERQYQHSRDGLEESGRPDGVGEEIAARTVNKERVQHGESATASSTSTTDIAASRRGGLRSHSGSAGRTKAQLDNEARQRNLSGRSTMTNNELEAALGGR